MTIKRYLFLLLATLIILMAASQIFLVDQLKQKIEQEIEFRGKRFANQILDMTLERLPENSDLDSDTEHVEFVSEQVDIEHVKPVKPKQKDKSAKRLKTDNSTKMDHGKKYKVKIFSKVNSSRKTYELFIDLNDMTPVDLEQYFGEEKVEVKQIIQHLFAELSTKNRTLVKGQSDDFKIIVEKDNRNARHAFKKQLKHLLKEVEIEHKKAENGGRLSESGQNTIVKVIEKRHRNANEKQSFLLDKLTSSITYIIIITSIIGIALVFWLSNKISQPIFSLAQGFREIEKGEKGAQVKVTGTDEIKFAINQFNKMSRQLVSLDKMESKLKERSHLEEIGDVSKGIAHALRNPLHTIGLAIDQLKRTECGEEEKQKLLQSITVKLAQLDKSISALLTLTSGQINRDHKIEINSLIKDVTLELKQSHVNDRGTLDIHFDLGERSTVIGESNELRSILHTIIFNAYEAAIGQNSDPIILTITKLEHAGNTYVTVVDNGGGIDPVIAKQLFSPHVSSKAEGAGMGLYIGKRIAELYYNGSLNIKNVKDGAKATLSLRNLQQANQDIEHS